MNYLLSFIRDITTGTRRNGSPCDEYATGTSFNVSEMREKSAMILTPWQLYGIIFFSWYGRSSIAREVSQGILSPYTPASPMSVGHKFRRPHAGNSGYEVPAFASYPGKSLPNGMTISLSFDPTVTPRYVQRTFISSGILCRIFRKIEQCPIPAYAVTGLPHTATPVTERESWRGNDRMGGWVLPITGVQMAWDQPTSKCISLLALM